MSEWQPIETAPKDRFLLLWSATDVDGFRHNVGRWDDKRHQWVLNFYSEPLEKQPTHWMPLPPPPHA